MPSLGSREEFYGWLRRIDDCPVYVAYSRWGRDRSSVVALGLRNSTYISWEQEHEVAKALLLKRLKAGCPLAALIYQEYVVAKLK